MADLYAITKELRDAIVHELRLRVFPRKELLADLSERMEKLPTTEAVLAELLKRIEVLENKIREQEDLILERGEAMDNFFNQ